MGNHQKAAQAYQQATVLKPDSAQAHLNLGVAHQELSDLPAARACYERALEIDGRSPTCFGTWRWSWSSRASGNWAEKLYDRIPEAAPEWCDATFRLGYLRLLRAEYAASAEAFRACLAKRPDWPEAHLNAGIAYARCGDPAEAQRYFQEALMMRPDSSDAVRGLAALALEQENYDEAYELHRRLIDLGEKSPELFYNAGLICQKRGQAERRGAVLPAGAQRGSAIRRGPLEPGARADGDGAGRRSPLVLAQGDSREARTGADVLRAADGVRTTRGGPAPRARCWVGRASPRVGTRQTWSVGKPRGRGKDWNESKGLACGVVLDIRGCWKAPGRGKDWNESKDLPAVSSLTLRVFCATTGGEDWFV